MAGYVIAVLLCLGDNCELVRVEPGIDYPTYDACSEASGKNAAKIGEITGRLQADLRRQAEIICLRERMTITELDDEYEALAPTIIRERPEASSPPVGKLERGRKAHVTGAVAGTPWLRITLPNGQSGFAYGERLRKVTEESAPTRAPAATDTARSTTAAPPAASPAPTTAIETASPRPASPPASPQASDRQAAVMPPPIAPPSPARPLQEFQDCDQCPRMISLPGGVFQMGSGNDPTERPPHSVAVPPFAIGKFEVTQQEWNFCVAAGSCAYAPRAGESGERQPMRNVSWDDAAQYTQWLRRLTGKSYRLPTEAEWEYAARAGTTSAYSWGSQIGTAKANCSGCGGAYDPHQPAAVGSFAANPWGLHDMLGGVAEWVEDCWRKNYDGAPTNGSAWVAPRCSQRILRGGSWKNPPPDVTVSSRNFYDASVRYAANGMRVALGLGEGR